MGYNIYAFSNNTEPRLFFRNLEEGGHSDEDLEKLQSTTFLKTLDLLSEGPIEGFCDQTGKLVTGIDILKGVYLNEIPIKNTQINTVNDIGAYNFRNVRLAFKKGQPDQKGFHQDDSVTNVTSPYYWLRDFSYSSQTINKSINLSNQVNLDSKDGTLQAKKINSQCTHSVIDQDVDWLGVTLNVGSCYTIADDGEQLPNVGAFHIWGDFTGITHRTIPENTAVKVLADGPGEFNAYVYISGLALSSYKEDIFFKLIDSKELASNRPRKIFIRNVTEQSFNFKSNFTASLDSVTEIVNSNLSYPSSALVASLINAENFSNIPQRSYHLKLKKIRVPSNYVDKVEGPDGPTKERKYAYKGFKKGSKHTSEERHEGVWDGTFKEELEWTDNPAWILWDLLTNDVYGIGEYLKDINIDRWAFYKVAKYCDQLVPTSLPASDANEFVQERRFSCNILIQNAAEAYQTINEIASVFRSLVYFDNLDVLISTNNLKDSVYTFTNDSVTSDGFSYIGSSYRTRFTAVKVGYKDKDDSFLPKYEYIEDPEGILRFGLLQKEVTAVGCTSRDQALRLGRWILLTANLEEESITFRTDRKAEFLYPGQVFTVYDKLRSDEVVGGRVKYLQNNKNNVQDNFILLDETLDIENRKYKSISFVIPSSDGSKNTIYKEFVHRNGKAIGGQDDGDRATFSIVPINSASSDNRQINNYLQNTPSGTKIITNSNEDLILLDPGEESYTSSTAQYKTLNDYFLQSGVLQNLRQGGERAKNTSKISEGAYYILHVEDDVGNDLREPKEYTLISKTENDDGSFTIAGLEYNRDKFDKTDVSSDIYDESTFEYDNKLFNRNLNDGDGALPPGNQPEEEEEVVQVINYGYPKANTVDLIVDPAGFVNADGTKVSLVNYYLHNTTENQKYYDASQSNSPRYELRVQEIDEEYYGKLLSSTVNDTPILQNGQYIIPGQSCGANKVLYDNAYGEFIRIVDADGKLRFINTVFTPTGKALIGGTDVKRVTIPNYKDSKFTDILKIERPRVLEETGKLNVEGCTVFHKTYSDKQITDVLSGQFELPNPEGFYEIRWSEANSHGRSAEKALFFRGSVDTNPPIPPDSFTASLNNLFPNLISFKWRTSPERDTDIYGFRIYTGHVGGDNPDLENTDVEAPPENYPNTESIPKENARYLLEVPGRNSVYANYTANTNDGRIRDDQGNPISVGDVAAFHIRAIDFAQNASDPVNSNLLSLFDLNLPPSFLLSGEIREEGKDTDRYGHYPILHAFYSGAFHELPSFNKYHIEIFDETNGVGIGKDYNIFKSDVRTDEADIYGIDGSGHFEIRNVLPNTTYFGRMAAWTVDGRSSPYAESTASIGADNFAPARLENFRVYKEFSNFRFIWDVPKEKDCSRILLFTGEGDQNFNITNEASNSINRIEEMPDQRPFASVNPDDSPAFPIDKFRHPDGTPWQKRQFPFHAVPVDTSNNTGVWADGEYTYVDLSPPQIHTSGSLSDDGNTYIHVFYSGISQNDQSFKYYHTEYQNVNEFEFKSYQDRTKAHHIAPEDRVHEIQKIGKGSGHFSFLAAGNRFYEVSTKVVLDVLETDFGDDVPLTNHLYGKSSVYIWAPPDQNPPPPPSWVSSSKNGNNIFLSWNNPSVHDLDSILLYTGYQNKTGEKDGTRIHDDSRKTSDIIALRDFHANTNKNLYFWLRAKDTSNNLSDFSVGNTSSDPVGNSGQLVSVGRTKQLDRDEIVITTGINLDNKGDGASQPFIEYTILDNPVNYQHAFYNIELARDPKYTTLVGTQASEITYGPDFAPTENVGSGVFSNLLANEYYYLRARIQEHDGKYSYWTEAADNPILTPKDDIPPIDPVNFYITSGPKQVYLEWEWGNGISRDTAHVLIYKTGIPTGRIENESHQENNCWSQFDISGYFQDNPEEYTYKQPASTSYIDNDIETGIVDPIHGGKKQTVLYHYFLKTVDRSNNTGEHFVSGIARDEHSGYWVNKAKTVSSSYVNDRYGTTPHTLGYITGGAVSANYISNVYAGRILTDKITAADFILSHPSGRVLSDNVYSMGSNNQTFAYSKGKGLYMDHKMFRIGDPEPGGHGLFWTGHKSEIYGDFTKPTFSKDRDGFHSMDIDPNTLEIRGNMTAGQILIGASNNSALHVDNEGNLSIGKQSRTLSGFFTGVQGVSGIMGEIPNYQTLEDPDAVYVQLNVDQFDAIQNAQFRALQFGGAFLETNWIRGYYRGWEIRQIESLKINGDYTNGYATAKLGIPFAAYEGFDFSSIEGNQYGLAGVVTTGSQAVQSDGVPTYRDWWRVHESKFKVTKEGVLFAADARILGTARADALEVNKTIVLGDVYNQFTSVIQSYGYVDGDICEDGVHPSGWKIVGDGHAVFKSIDIRSGVISGSMGLSIGKTCGGDDNFFRVNEKGEFAVGDKLVLKHNKFFVSRQGDMRARNAVISGDLDVTGTIDVGGGIRLCADVYRNEAGNFVDRGDGRGIYITRHDIRSSNFSDSYDNGPGFKIDNKGRTVFHDIKVTGGFISGVSIIAGKGTELKPYFKVFNNGEMSIGSYDSPSSAPKNTHPFYVNRFGDMYAENAYVRGTITGRKGKIGSLYIDEEFLSTWSWNTLKNAPELSKIRQSNDLETQLGGAFQKDTNPYRKGIYLDINGNFSIVNDYGRLLGYDFPNDYLTITGLASSNNKSAILNRTIDENGLGDGFYLSAKKDTQSWIANFSTDPHSATGVANLVETQINGDIQFPIADNEYFIMNNTPINYKVLRIYAETNDGTCSLSFYNNKKIGNTQSVFAQDMNSVGTAGRTQHTATLGYNHIDQSNGFIIIKVKSVAAACTSIRFRIDLQRTGGGRYTAWS